MNLKGKFINVLSSDKMTFVAKCITLDDNNFRDLKDVFLYNDTRWTNTTLVDYNEIPEQTSQNSYLSFVQYLL